LDWVIIGGVSGCGQEVRAGFSAKGDENIAVHMEEIAKGAIELMKRNWRSDRRSITAQLSTQGFALRPDVAQAEPVSNEFVHEVDTVTTLVKQRPVPPAPILRAGGPAVAVHPSLPCLRFSPNYCALHKVHESRGRDCDG
jgi:hypothetical protein